MSIYYTKQCLCFQMDNAQDLLSFGGLQVVINGLNSTEPLVKEYAAFVLGAAFQVSSMDGRCIGQDPLDPSNYKVWLYSWHDWPGGRYV